MRNDPYKALGIVVVAIVSAIGALAVVQMLIALPIPDGKGPEWIGAIGTVLTLAGTIWLATSESRRRHHDELIKARLRAMGMMLRVVNARGAIGHTCRDLHVASFYDQSPSTILATAAHLRHIDLWTIDETEPLVPLPNNLAALLAQSADEIASVKKMFEHADAGGVLGNRDDRLAFVTSVHHLLATTAANLDKCIVECTRAREHLYRPELDSRQPANDAVD